MCRFKIIGVFSLFLLLTIAKTAQLSSPVFEECGAAEFRCSSGSCIESQQRCNRKLDCPDGSDEVDCDQQVFSTSVRHTRAVNSTEVDQGEDSENYYSAYEEEEPTIFGGPGDFAFGVFASIPYQLSLQIRRNESWTHICGAVIIDRKTALTAAHCFQGRFKPTDFRVVAGVTQLDSSSSTKQVLPLQRIIQHPRFNSRDVFKGNDIAVLHVAGSFVFNENVQNIWISPPQEINLADFRGRISGWGKTSNNGDLSNSLQKADMRILPDSECQKAWPFLTPSMMCTYENKSNTCEGDAGGPLVIQNYQFNQNATRDLLVGIASFSPKDCEKLEEPNAFTKVSHFYNWIKENRAKRSNSLCQPTEFQCFNGECIDQELRCDKKYDCEDGSDEKACETHNRITQSCGGLIKLAHSHIVEGDQSSDLEELLLQFFNSTSSSNSAEDLKNNIATGVAAFEKDMMRCAAEKMGVIIRNLTQTVENLTSKIQELEQQQKKKNETDFLCITGNQTETRTKLAEPQGNLSSFPPAAAWGFEAFDDSRDVQLWNYNATEDGACHNFKQRIGTVEGLLGPSCVILYQHENCSQEKSRSRLQLDTKNFPLELDMQINFAIPEKSPKSIGVCS